MQGGEEIVAQLEACCEVVAAQFASGMEIARLVQEWSRDAQWVEAAIRRALLTYIPERSGGLRPPRSQAQAARREEDWHKAKLQPALPLGSPGAGAIPGRVFPAGQVVGYAENGYRVGESHHNTRIPDELVDRIREMHEDCGKSVAAIAEELELPFGTVAKICAYQRRATPAVRFRRVNP